MIMKETVTNYLITLSKFSTKRGTDIAVNAELKQAINALTEEGELVAIYVNDRDNFNIPDVCVMPCYDTQFSRYLLDPDTPVLCPYGYTIEIHNRCFTKYTDEELGALILHDILQNVLSDTAKIRFLKAYTAVISKYPNDRIIKLFCNMRQDEVLYMAFLEICIRPFRVPASNAEYVSTDEVLKVLGLADAYDSYLTKRNPDAATGLEPELALEFELKRDARDLDTIITACMDNDLGHYYNMIRKGVPLLTVENVLRPSRVSGYTMVVIHHRPKPQCNADDGEALSESFNNPTSTYEIRFQIDKIIGNMRYAESEAEREVVLFKIKQLSIKLYGQLEKLEKIQSPNKMTADKITFLRNALDELEGLREKTVNMEIKEKRWHVYVKGDMPEGYDF